MTAEPTDTDWARALRVLRHQLGPEDVERVAQALADERQRALAPVLELAAHYDTPRAPDDRYGQNRIARSTAAREIRRAAGQQP
jgi:hypothetical protein